MSQVTTLRYDWDTVHWPRLERNVFKLQKRIYRASQKGDQPTVRKLQRLLLCSASAKWLAVRRVTQDNRGKKTAGVDGQTALTKNERHQLVEDLPLTAKAMPIRRVWIPKPGKAEKRPLGIPTIRDRVNQALVKMGLEPEWEAKFEPNSYGFRPGRSAQDAIAAIYGAIKNKQAYVLDADIAGCFDNIDHAALLDKLKCSPFLRRRIKSWLKAGVMDGSVLQPNQQGTPQGGIISPLLANIALHGLEMDTKQALGRELLLYMKQKRGKGSYMLSARMLSIIRYADDFVIIHEDQQLLLKAKEYITTWLQAMGLTLKETKTRLCHTYQAIGDQLAGFNFLGFHVRQYWTCYI
jgi:RNA-directed DNA polymerase